MAASDPTPSVPTPTGALQGVAAFSWSGSAWQPTAGAGASVATPTGVLRGVAPFSWDGASWQPFGRAQPGVAATTGVLDGVAVYTWSGSAWTPASGNPSTPTGPLRGVAAFNWDGTAWQPAGRAGPTVSTPYGVLDGVAMFNWSGSAWAAVAGPALNISFMSAPLDARVTFSRASSATYFDSTGVIQTAATNVPRIDCDPVTHAVRGLLLEEARTNVLLNSATLGTQSVAVTAQSYTLSFYGTGTVTLSGAFAGSLVGTGAFPTRAQLVFTPAAGTLTCTVTGSVLNANLEPGSFFPTSYIPTAGAASTRAADVCGISSANMGFFASPGGSWFAEFTPAIAMSGGTAARIIAQPSTGGITALYLNSSSQISQYDGVGVAPTTNTLPTITSTGKAASTWAPGQARTCLNGGAIASAATLTTGYGVFASGGVGFMTPSATSAENMTGYIRNVRYWSRVLSDAEMQSITT